MGTNKSKKFITYVQCGKISACGGSFSLNKLGFNRDDSCIQNRALCVYFNSFFLLIHEADFLLMSMICRCSPE